MRGFTPSRTCPEGTKLWFLHLGNLDCDEGFVTRAGGTSTASNPNPESKRRKLVVMAALIEMPNQDGLILFETGCGENMDDTWGDVLQDVFAPNPRPISSDLTLPAQIAKTGHDISEVKHVIMGHLHLDHAGGLDTYFKDREDVTVHVHEEELKHAYWAIATKNDLGVYLPHYMSLSLKWETFNDSTLELFPGLHLLHSPGHTPGLVVMMLHLKKDGTFIFTTDQYHVKENFYDSAPQGWLARDHNNWWRSHCTIKRLQQQYDASICFGHDWEVFKSFKANPDHYVS